MNYKSIFENVKQVVRYCNQLPNNAPLDMFMWHDSWLNSKYAWIKLIPELIAELPEPVTFKIDEDSKRRFFDEFIVDDLLEDNYPDLQDFLMNIGYKEFFGKHLQKNYEFWDEFEEKDIVIPKGTKIIKAFKYFHLLDDDLKELQTKASRIVQQDCVTGTLCLSVHPLDYLSISENISNWRSCHSLDGCYKSGNISYMLDKSTVVAYLRSDNKVQLPNFPEGLLWNNKKWRMLLHFDKNNTIVFTSKQYPFSSEGAFNPVIKLINQVFKDGEGERWFSHFQRDFITTSNGGKNIPEKLIYIGTQAKPLRSIVKQDSGNLAYTDLIFNESLKYRWSYGHIRGIYEDDSWEDDTYGFDKLYDEDSIISSGLAPSDTQITLGESVLCPICNKNRLYDPDLMICSNCEEAFFSEQDLNTRRKERFYNG